jgi:peptidoglycan/LPS O-acetylase OafA/YrhL
MTYTLIQALRAVLCVGVVLMHIKIYLNRLGDPSIFDYIPDILGGIPCGFFAVSGYFMSFLVDRNTPNFLVQRLVRVYPTYFIVVGMAFVMRAFTSIPLSFDDLPQVLSLLPFGMGKSYKLGIEWTLVYEIWYYFICAFFCRPGWHKRFPAFLVAWALFQIVWDTVAFMPPKAVPNFLTVWIGIWNYSFILGALTYYYLQRRAEPVTQAWAGYLMLASGVVTAHLHQRGYGILYVLGVFSCLLVDWLIQLESRVRAPKFLAKLGDYSYALYLIHSTIIILTLDRWQHITGQPPGIIAGLVALVLCLGAFWFLGQMDVAIHKKCKGYVAGLMPSGFVAFARSILPLPAARPDREKS